MVMLIKGDSSLKQLIINKATRADSHLTYKQNTKLWLCRSIKLNTVRKLIVCNQFRKQKIVMQF